MKPERFGKYTILRRLGRGGMAEVFLASTPALDGRPRVLALKRLLPSFSLDNQIISMMTDEARVCAWLNHPNIAQVLDFGRAEQTYYLSLEFVGGCDLCDLIRVPNGGIGRPLPTGTALYIMHQVASALDYAHRRCGPGGEPLGIIHRDMSPHNVLLSTEGEVKITDFGLARASISLHYSTADVIRGKFSYMPREQALGNDIDQRIDLFAAGVTLYEALTGVKPYTSNTLAEQIYQLEQRIPPPSALVPEIPAEVDAITQHAMCPTVDGRYASAGAFAADLQRALARFSSPGREAEHLATLVRAFIGEDAAYFSRLEHMTLADFPVLDGSIIADELDAVRSAASGRPLPPGYTGASSMDEFSDFTDEVELDDDDTLTEEEDDDLLPRTMLSDPHDHRPPPPEPRATMEHEFLPVTEEVAAHRDQAAMDPEFLDQTEQLPEQLREAGALHHPPEDLEDLELDDTVLADDGASRRWADQALGLSATDQQPTIQRSPEEMIGAFERALRLREQEKQEEARRVLRRKLLLACLIGGALALFAGGFSIGWMLQGQTDDIPTVTAPVPRGPDARPLVRAAQEKAPLPVAPRPVARPGPDAARADAAAAPPDRGSAARPDGPAPASPGVARDQVRDAAAPRRPRPPRPAPAQAKAEPAAPKAGKTGFLSVNTDSPARVYVGDSPKSTPAPINKMPLPAGIHRVRVFFEKKKSFSETQWVSINVGQTFTLYFSSPTE